MFEALKRRLQRYARLSCDELDALDHALQGSVRRFDAHRDILRDGDAAEHVYFIVSGWACRYKILEDGRRQNMAYLIDGDICDLSVLRQIDHSIETITPARIAEAPREAIAALCAKHSRLASAFQWSAVAGEATLREWIVTLGQRTAPERLAHFFCEIFVRCRCVGLVDGRSCPMPLTQCDLAATVGLSTVHVNRTLQELRSEKLIALSDKRLTIPDFERLQSLALFDAHYLHLDREGRHLDINETARLDLAAVARA